MYKIMKKKCHKKNKGLRSTSALKISAFNANGLTLIELIVALMIIGVLCAISIPGFFKRVPDFRLKAAARDFYTNMQKAKISAIKNNTFCTVTFNKDAGGDIIEYIIYLDNNENVEFDAGDEIVTRVNWSIPDVSFDPCQGGPILPACNSLSTSNAVTFTDNDDGMPSISFKPDGIPTNNGGGFANGTAFFVNSNERQRNVVINQVGNIALN